jgi:hypothetical protein
MHKSAMKCNETLGKWCKNKHEASKIMDTLETYQLTGKGTVGRKAKVCMDGHSFTQAHFTVLHNSTVVALYIERHKNILRSKNPGKVDSWIKGEHEKTFGSWLQTHLMNNNTVGDQLYCLARPPSLTKGTR